MKFKFKKHLQDLKRERVGTYRRISSGLYLDRNERITPFSAKILGPLHQRLVKCCFNLYPDVDQLYSKVANWIDIDEKKIYITEGVSGAIKSLIEAIAHPGDNIVFPTPTFALYPIYCQMFNLKYRTVGYKGDYSLDLDRMLKLIDNNTAIVFLPNPNVPIEGTLWPETVALIARYCQKNKTFLAIDEVYFGFGGPTAVDLIDRFDNLFVMRSFSKAFGLAGIRIGYILGSPDKIDYVSKIRTGYETNTVSMEIASFFLDNFNLIEDYIKDVKEGLSYLKNAFKRLGLEYHGGDTSNFIYVNLHNPALVKKVAQKLERKNIYIRANWRHPYSGGFTVTGAPKVFMQQFISELTAILRSNK